MFDIRRHALCACKRCSAGRKGGLDMTQRRSPAKDVAKPRRGGYWIDHAAITNDDLAWLEHATELTLWNVTVPAGFLARLPKLAWLDVRGGSAVSLSVAGASGLEYLAVNQVRGLADVAEIASLARLRYLSLYGLTQLAAVPSLAGMAALTRVEIGQMKSMASLAPILAAPNLRELLLQNRVAVSAADVAAIQKHPSLEMFDWSPGDVPVKLWEPVLQQVTLPRTRTMHPDEWFALPGNG